MPTHSEVYSDPTGAVVAAFSDVSQPTVTVWETENWSRICSFNCQWDFGGARCALNESVIFTARFKGGVAAYSLPSGECVWSRSDIREVQQLSYYDAHKLVFCVCSLDTVYCLEAKTGATVAQFAGYERIYTHSSLPIYLASSPHEIALRTGVMDTFRKHSTTSFGLLAAAFSSDVVLASEVNSGTRCFSLATGDELPAARLSGHFTVIAPTTSAVDFVAVNLADGPRICRINVSSGAVAKEFPQQDLDGTFVMHGSAFLRVTGSLINTLNGATLSASVFA